MMGDSAGGGLCFALCLWLIENNQRKPDLLLLSYPALAAQKTYYVESAYIGLEDYFLHLSAMKTVSQFYVPEDYEKDADDDYYLNHVRTPDELLL